MAEDWKKDAWQAEGPFSDASFSDAPQTGPDAPQAGELVLAPPEKYSDEEREEIKFLVRQAIYSFAGITGGRVAAMLRKAGIDISRQLATYYIRKVQQEDAEAERIRGEIPDLTTIRAQQRKHREAVFNAAMRAGDFGQANRALDALAALDGLATGKSPVALQDTDGKPAALLDPARMSDAELRARIAAAVAAKEQTPEKVVEQVSEQGG